MLRPYLLIDIVTGMVGTGTGTRCGCTGPDATAPSTEEMNLMEGVVNETPSEIDVRDGEPMASFGDNSFTQQAGPSRAPGPGHAPLSCGTNAQAQHARTGPPRWLAHPRKVTFDHTQDVLQQALT